MIFPALLLPLLLASYQGDTRLQQSVEEEITVIGKRLNTLSVIVGRTPEGKLTCLLDRSSGSTRLDKRLCKTAAKCVRKNKDNPSDMAIKGCIDKEKPKLLAKLRRELKA